VAAVEVNAALADAINALPRVTLPADDGVAAGQVVGAVEFVAVTGDIANRQEAVPLRIQPAAASWAQFEQSFAQRLSLRTSSGAVTPLMVVPGNHDLSNAIGWVGTMIPARDATAMVRHLQSHDGSGGAAGGRGMAFPGKRGAGGA
jgi:3',5'-cyclic AMP phosphodiesterase CpdA